MCISIGLGKGFYISLKDHLCLTEWHLAKPEELVETKSPWLEITFDTIDSNQKKRDSKRALFNNASDLQMPYLSKAGPDR